MAIARDTHTSATATASSVTLSYTVTGSNTLLVFSLHLNSGTISGTPQFNGVNMTQLGTVAGTPGAIDYIYGIVGQSGTHNITASFSGSTAYELFAASYTGVSQVNLPDSVNSKAENSVITSTLTVTSILNNCWIFGYSGADAVNNTVAGSVTALDSINTSQFLSYDSNGALAIGGHNITSNVNAGPGHSYTAIAVTFAPVQPIVSTLACATGSFSLTGELIVTPYNRKVILAVGTFALTGFSMTFSLVRKWINSLKSSSSFTNTPKH